MSNAPTHHLYVNVGGEGSKMKLKVGAVFMHSKGDGFNIVLNANPIDGKMVAFPVKDEDEAEPAKKESTKAK